MIRRLLCRLPWWFRERTGIGLPPPERLVFATIAIPGGRTISRWGRYYARRRPYIHPHVNCRVVSAGFLTNESRNGVGHWDARGILDWYDPKEHSL